jgi:hypothetical protein
MGPRAMVRMVCPLVAAMVVAGCASGASPPAALPFLPAELDALAAGRTLRVPAGGGSPFETLLFVGPGSRGWLDERVVPGTPPSPGDMSMVFEWGAVPGSRLCVWATPRIGQMPSFVPPSWQCVQVLRSGQPPQGLSAVVERGEAAHSGPLELLPFNAFPAATIAQYLEQVRVLYGGEIPNWTHP